jgi:hypothetical protein
MKEKQVTTQMLDGAFRFLECRKRPVVNQFLNQPHPTLIPAIYKIINRQRKILAKRYHPDLNPNPIKNMKEINNICDLLLTLRWYQPPPQPEVIVTFYYSDYGTGSADYTTSSTSFF